MHGKQRLHLGNLYGAGRLRNGIEPQQAPRQPRSTMRRTGPVLALSVPVSSSALPARPPPYDCQWRVGAMVVSMCATRAARVDSRVTPRLRASGSFVRKIFCARSGSQGPRDSKEKPRAVGPPGPVGVSQCRSCRGCPARTD